MNGIPFYWIPILPGENSKAFWKYPKGESHFRKTKVSEHFEHSSTGNARRVQLLLFRKFWLFLGFATEHKEAGIQKILILLNFDPDCLDIWGFGFFAPTRVPQRTEGKNKHFISLFSWLLRIRNSGKIKFFIFVIFLPKVQNSKLWSFMFQPQFNNVRNTRTHNFFLFFHPLSDFEISKLIIFHFSNNFSIFVFSLNLGTLESHFTGFPFYREKIASSNLWESHFTEIPFNREHTVLPFPTRWNPNRLFKKFSVRCWQSTSSI